MPTGEINIPPVFRVARPDLIGSGTNQCNGCAGRIDPDGCLLHRLLPGGDLNSNILIATEEPSFYATTQNGKPWYQDEKGRPPDSVGHIIKVEDNHDRRDGKPSTKSASFDGDFIPFDGYEKFDESEKHHYWLWILGRYKSIHSMWQQVMGSNGEHIRNVSVVLRFPKKVKSLDGHVTEATMTAECYLPRAINPDTGEYIPIEVERHPLGYNRWEIHREP